MGTDELKNEMEGMVLSDLADLYRKLSSLSTLNEPIRMQAAEFVVEFESMVEFLGGRNTFQHFQREQLLLRMALFLPEILEVQVRPTIPTCQ